MKKITFFILTIFTVATLFAAARPSLDGRAVVAESGTMPRGLFARTVGYLPGDSVTVTNPATGSSVDVLILGSIDPSEGVAILLSPESAEALRIKPNSNVQVKLTKRAGSLDENANGSAVLSEGDDAPQVTEESPAEETPAVSEDKPAESSAETTETIEEVPAAAEETPAESPAEAVEEVKAVPEETSQEPVAEPVEESPAVPEEKPVEETPVEPVEETPAVSEEVPVEEKAEPDAVYEEVPPLPQELEKVEEEELPAEDEKMQKVILVPGEEENTEAPVEEETAAETEAVEEEIPAGIESEPDVVVEESAPEELPVEEKTDEYQPIILVPAEPNPPVEEKTETAVEEDEVEKLPVVENPVVTNSWEHYVVPSLKNLKSSFYYVQIASLSNIDNIKNIIDKYSSKYPIVLVQNSSKTAYQVMVGPLNVDEYGSVSEKFKAYGFKDSFLRKIK